MAELMASRSQGSQRTRIAVAFISWVVGAACAGGVFLLFHGWSEGAAYFLGALSVGVVAFIGHVFYIRASQ
jgi:hypothetical protein